MVTEDLTSKSTEQYFMLDAGTYEALLYGAAGEGSGGTGGYVRIEFTLNNARLLYAYTGIQPSTPSAGGWGFKNGGDGANVDTENIEAGGGGGATALFINGDQTSGDWMALAGGGGGDWDSGDTQNGGGGGGAPGGYGGSGDYTGSNAEDWTEGIYGGNGLDAGDVAGSDHAGSYTYNDSVSNVTFIEGSEGNNQSSGYITFSGDNLNSPITIDGNNVRELTVDGDLVRELTIDGTVVFTD